MQIKAVVISKYDLCNIKHRLCRESKNYILSSVTAFGMLGNFRSVLKNNLLYYILSYLCRYGLHNDNILWFLLFFLLFAVCYPSLQITVFKNLKSITKCWIISIAFHHP